MAGPFTQTNQGQPTSGVSSFLYGTDPVANRVEKKTGFQQLGNLLLQPQVLANLTAGWKAPSIAPAQREATRHFQQEVVPGLLHNVAAGGSEGGYLRGLQGAGSDLQSKLAALQYEKQFELQKLRQEQLPKLFELGQQSQFDTHISDKPINWNQVDDPNKQRLLTGQIEQTRPFQWAKRAGIGAVDTAENLGQRGAKAAQIAGNKISTATRDWFNQPPTSPAEWKRKDQEIRNAYQAAGKRPPLKANEVPLPIQERISRAMTMAKEGIQRGGRYIGKKASEFEEATRPSTAPEATKASPSARAAQKIADKHYGKPGIVQPTLAQQMDDRRWKMVKDIKKMKNAASREFEEALKMMDNPDQIDEFYRIAKTNPNRTKWEKVKNAFGLGY